MPLATITVSSDLVTPLRRVLRQTILAEVGNHKEMGTADAGCIRPSDDQNCDGTPRTSSEVDSSEEDSSEEESSETSGGSDPVTPKKKSAYTLIPAFIVLILAFIM